MSKTYRVAVIGCGYIAQRSHMPAWHDEPRASLAAVCDANRARAELAAQHFNIENVYGDVGEMFDAEQLDVVDIATRPDSHLPLVQKAAERGLAILCQKPLADSMDQAQQLVRVAEQHDVPLMVTENWRWLPMYRSARHYIEQGRIGRPYTARIFASAMLRRENPVSSTQPYLAEMPRLVIFEMCIHWIDCLRAMFGNVRQVFAQTRRVNPALAGEDLARLMLTFDDGATALIDVSWACPDVISPGEALRVEGERGALTVHNKSQKIFFNRFDSRMAEPLPILPQADSFCLLHSHFIEQLDAGRRDFVTSGRDNLNTLAAVFAAYQSAETNQAVDVPTPVPADAPPG